MSSTPERSVRLDGTDFRYRETGDSSGPVLVLLHALGEDASDWDEVAAALSNRYRVLALDQRGHGQSEYTARYSFELMRDDLRDFVDALGLEQFSLMGHSMGGLVALLFAEEHPERVQRLAIEGAAPPAGSDNRPEPPPEPPEPVSFDWRVVAPIRRQLNDADPAWWEPPAPDHRTHAGRGGRLDEPYPAERTGGVEQADPRVSPRHDRRRRPRGPFRPAGAIPRRGRGVPCPTVGSHQEASPHLFNGENGTGPDPTLASGLAC
jgi:pimeloyl-ACP methyl ester carboxylesterase